jgi:hypothetical protein
MKKFQNSTKGPAEEKKRESKIKNTEDVKNKFI